MKNLFSVLGVAIILSVVVFATHASATGESQVTVFSGVRVFDGKKSIPMATVFVVGSEITELFTNNQEIEMPANAEVISGEGMTLLPGLIDSHTHIFDRSMLERALDFGVTTVMSMYSTSPDFMQAIKSEDRKGMAFDRADMLSSGIGMTVEGGHGTQFGPVPTVSGPEDVEDFVSKRVVEGSDYLKIIYDNFKMIDREVPSVDKATLIAAVAAAHRHQIMAVIHSRDVDAYADDIEAGADGIVHALVDQLPGDTLVESLVEKDIFIIPTLSVSTPSGADLANDPALGPKLTEDEIKNLRAPGPPRREGGSEVSVGSVTAFHKGGITILAGSDSPNRGTTTGASIHQELALLVEAGLSPSQALTAATSRPAEVFGLADRGRIAPGYKADLLQVKGNPPESILDTRNIVGVWKAGNKLE